jgi:hypothetical protein
MFGAFNIQCPPMSLLMYREGTRSPLRYYSPAIIKVWSKLIQANSHSSPKPHVAAFIPHANKFYRPMDLFYYQFAGFNALSS